MITTFVRVSRDLTEIIRLGGDLRTQAIHQAGATIDGRSLPGGAAMIALAPVADQRRWEQLTEAAERDWAQQVATRRGIDLHDAYADPNRPDFTADEDDTTEPALQVLRFWTDHYRRVRHADWDHQPTLDTEAKFLQHQLQWISSNEPNWDHLAHDISRVRIRLENIVHAGTRPERSRVVCNNPTCPAPRRLIRVYADVDQPETDDRWKCTACRTRYDDDAFARAHAQQLRHDSAAKFVHLPDAIGTLVAQGRNERVVRRWLEPPLRHTDDRCTVCKATWPPEERNVCPGKIDARTRRRRDCGGELTPIIRGNPDAVVESYCDLTTHKVWVWWPDLWRLHLATPVRTRRTA